MVEMNELDSLGIISYEEYVNSSLRLIMEKLKVKPIELIKAIKEQREMKSK